MAVSTTTSSDAIFADWMQKALTFPDPGHGHRHKPINISCWIALHAEQLVVTVHTVCYSQYFNDTHRQGWTSGIKSCWDGEFLIEADATPGGGHDVPLSVPGTETPAVLRPQTWQVPIVFDPRFYKSGDPNAPANADCSPPIHRIVDPAVERGDTNNWWGKDRNPQDTMGHMAAHEFGHYIGCGDEYGLHEAAFQSVVGRAPRPDERMVGKDGVPNGLYSTHDSIMGLYTDQFPKRRHAEMIVDWLNETYVPRQSLVERFILRTYDELGGDPIGENDWSWYTVQEGEWLSHIAERHGYTWDQLYNYDPVGGEPNRMLLSSGDPNLIYPGEQIRVPNGG